MLVLVSENPWPQLTFFLPTKWSIDELKPRNSVIVTCAATGNNLQEANHPPIIMVE